jgi:hypothetical protein
MIARVAISQNLKKRKKKEKKKSLEYDLIFLEFHGIFPI